jgi:hypothetical protein
MQDYNLKFEALNHTNMRQKQFCVSQGHMARISVTLVGRILIAKSHKKDLKHFSVCAYPKP